MRKILSFVLALLMLFLAFPAGVIAEGKTDTPAPIAPIVLACTADSVVLAPIVGYEYKMNDGTWQTSNLFTGLLPLTEYVFYQRVAETAVAYASPASAGTAAVTDKPVAETPPAPTVRNYDATYVRLVYTSGYEYKMDDGPWQDNAVFRSNFGEPHRYYQRVAESSENYASESSEALVYELGKIDRPELPVNSILDALNMWSRVSCDSYDGYYYTYDWEYSSSSYQYSLDGVDWKGYPRFSGLKPGTEYTLYVRWKPDILYYPTEGVELKKFTTKTLADIALSPAGAVSLKNKTDTTIEVESNWTFFEYILTDLEGNALTDWQESGLFTGLEPDTKYIIYSRYSHEGDRERITKEMSVKTLKTGEIYYQALPDVKITGVDRIIGSTLVVQLSNIYIPEGATVTVQWYRDGMEIPGASGIKYITTKDDVFSGISVIVTVESDDVKLYGRANSNVFLIDDHLLGDVNGDFKVNLADASMTLKYIAKWDVTGFIYKAANINNDTSVNLVDVSLMLQKIAGWRK